MPLTIVMYHYVRRIKESRYPDIRGLERDQFIEQVGYLKRYYEPVTARQIIEAVRGGCRLPENAVLLTFDDGYLDHFTNVFPILQKEKVYGCFFPPAKCILERVVLDVNKIQFILASTPDRPAIVSQIHTAVDASRGEFKLDTIDDYMARYSVADRFDSAEVRYIKRMLQVGLPEALRSRIVDILFKRFVSEDEKAFANELYMDEDQLGCMVASGMTVGSHGYDHLWMNIIESKAQEREIDLSLKFLRRIGVPAKDWIMCYPYGGWNDSLLQLLRLKGCALGLTTEVGLAPIEDRDLLLLPRLDTNDLPKSANAAPSEWTIRAQTSRVD